MADEPARIDRETAEAVLRRALERSSAARSDDPAGLTSDQLVAVGRELGLAEDDVRSAIGDVIGGGSAAPRRGGLLGPRGAVGSRAVEADVETASGRVAGWLEHADCLRQVRSSRGGTTVWEPRGGLVVELRKLQRQLRGEPPELRRGRRVTASVERFDAQTSLVALDVEIGPERALVGLGFGVLLALGAGALVVVTALALLLVPVVLLACLGVGIAAQRREARRVARAVERRLDAIAQGPPPVDDPVDVGATARELARTASRALRPPRPPRRPGG